MKKIRLVFILFLIGLVGITALVRPDITHAVLYFSYCDRPIPYRIGTIDPRFNLSREEVVTTARQAAATWNQAMQKELLSYDPDAELEINLVYDRRQLLKTQIHELDDQTKMQEQSLREKKEGFERDAAAFKARVEAFRKKVEEVNARGGATPEEYESLMKEQQSLGPEADRLNLLAQELNLTVQSFNEHINDFNATVDTFNEAIEAQPEEGIYDPNDLSISIYFHDNPDEFMHTLTHEFGHALGIDHTANPQAIMYPKTSTYTSLHEDDITMLQEVCADRSRLSLIQQNITFIIDRLQTNLQLALNR